MENEKRIQSLVANSKEMIYLYTTYMQVASKKILFTKKKQYKYSEIEKISLNISDEVLYVKTGGNFASLSFTIKKKGIVGFDFFEYDVREIKFHTSRIVAFVGSLKACMSAALDQFDGPKIEVIEPEIISYDPNLSYRRILENNQTALLEEKKSNKNNDPKLLE